MPTIHMEIDQVKSVLDLMNRDQAAIREITGNLQNAVSAIHNTEWTGNAEKEFYGEYEHLESNLKQQIDAMETLVEQLRQEISQWEAMADRLG